MSITQLFWRWFLVWAVLLGVAALLNGASFFVVLFGYSFMALGIGFVVALGHFAVREFFTSGH